MSNLIKAHINLLYTVELEYAVADYFADEVEAILEKIAYNTELEGFDIYTVNHCDYRSKKSRFKTSRRDSHQLTFSIVVEVEGKTEIDTFEVAQDLISANMVEGFESLAEGINIKAVVTGFHQVEQIKVAKPVKAISESPVDKAIANVVNILEAQEGKKGYYRAIQKALKAVKDYDKSLVPIKLNAKTSDLTACAKALRKYTAQ